MSRCRSCQAPIFWTITTAGKLIPLDASDQGEYMAPKPTPGGLVEFTGQTRPGRDGAPLREVAVHPQPPLDDVRRFTAHFATCPNAETHRKTRR